MGVNQIQTGIFVLGMHRSGTSCIAGMLQSAGMESGEINKWSVDNQKGNRESKTVTQINDNILMQSGGSWKSPPETINLKGAHSNQRDALLKPLVEGFRPWVLKDPRLTITLQFWLGAVPNAHLLGVFRSPIDVATSLSIRDSMSLADGLRLWQKYNSRLLKYHLETKIPLIHFPDSSEFLSSSLEQNLQDWFETEISEKILTPTRLIEFIDQKLIHHQFSSENELRNQISTLNLESLEVQQIHDTWNALKKSSVNKPEKYGLSQNSSVSKSAPTTLQVDRVNLLNRTGKTTEAIAKLETILKQQPNRADLWQLGAKILRKSAEPQELAKWVDLALNHVKGDPELNFQKALVCWVLGDADNAISIAEDLCLQFPDWEDPVIQLGQWHFEMGHWESSAKKLISLRSYDTHKKQSHMSQFAQIYIDSGDGYSEAQSIKFPINVDGKVQSAEFDLIKFSNVKKIRFDPLNDSAVVRIESAKLVTLDMNSKVTVMKPENAYKTINSTYYFTSDDPRFQVIAEQQDFLNSSKFQIEFTIIKYAKDALIELLEIDDVSPQADRAPPLPVKSSYAGRVLTDEAGSILGNCLFEGTHPSENTENMVLVKGWFISKDSRKINVALRYDGLTRSYPLNINRPDLIENHSEPGFGSAQNSNFAFQYKVPKSTTVDIVIEHGMRL